MVMAILKNTTESPTVTGEDIGICTLKKKDCLGHSDQRENMVVLHHEDFKEFEGLNDEEKTILMWGFDLFTNIQPKKLSMAEKRKQLKKGQK